MKINSVLKFTLILGICCGCNVEKSALAPVTSIPASCRVNLVESVKDNTTKSSQTFEYDSKNRLVKSEYKNTTVTFEYDENDFLLTRTSRNSATVFTVDRFTYKNEKIVLVETTRNLGLDVIITKINYEYDSSGNLLKISQSDNRNNFTNSIYKNNILTQKTSNKEAFEINSLGLITKITTILSEGILNAGQSIKYTYDNNGQVVKTESDDKNGVIVNVRLFEYTNTKNIERNYIGYENSKGFPSIGKSFTQNYLKKESTLLLNKSSNKFDEFLSFNYENHVFDKNGLIQSYSTRLNEGNFTSISVTTYFYSGCN